MNMKKIISVFFVLGLFSGCYYDNFEELSPAPPIINNKAVSPNTCDTTNLTLYSDVTVILNVILNFKMERQSSLIIRCCF